MNSLLYLHFLYIEFMYSLSLNYSFSQFSNFNVYGVNNYQFLELHVLAVFPSDWLYFRVIAGDHSELGLLKSRNQLLFESSRDALVVSSCNAGHA